MSQSTFPDTLNHIWAKKPENLSESGETLVEHTWALLQRLSEQIKLRPYLPQIIKFPELWHCLFWASFLHDFGKSSIPFQQSLRGGKRWNHRHEVFSLLFLDWLEEACTRDEQIWIMSAIISHHKEPTQIFELYDIFDDELKESFSTVIKDCFDKETVQRLWEWLANYSLQWINKLDLNNYAIKVPAFPEKNKAIEVIYTTGSQRLRFWLKQYYLLIKKLKNNNDASVRMSSLTLRGLINAVDYSASAHTGEMLKASMQTSSDLLNIKKLNQSNLYQHQSECMQVQGTTVLIAPTGSGKTESSLLWALNQQNEYGRPPRIFYMLPYQASMNAMYDRLNSYGFSDKVGLEHGRSVLALYKRMIDEGNNYISAASSAKWARMLARLNYYPVKVLSPYQLLKAVFRLKTYELILIDYFNAVVILDEIHAYEPEKLALIFGMANFLKENFHTNFFIMSATFPALVLKQLKHCLGNFYNIKASKELYLKFQRHCVHLLDDEITSDSALTKIISTARKGKSVLVCCNRVKRAQEVFQVIKNNLNNSDHITALLLHGRFNARDRLVIEKKINSLTGSRSQISEAVILVATQVVEVSLDIDLDVIFTEPAPLEALIQRFGRINRRRLQTMADVFIFTQPANGQNIYLDELVEKALSILENNNNQPIQEEKVSEWIDNIYDSQIGEMWKEKFFQVYDNFLNGILPFLYGYNTNIGKEKDFYMAFDSLDVLPSSLESEYSDLIKIDPLKASELLVPIRPGQLRGLKTWKLDDLTVVDAEYGELGLCL